MRHFLL